jgi:hypothetical protein
MKFPPVSFSSALVCEDFTLTWQIKIFNQTEYAG